MAWFQLDPESLAARATADSENPKVPSLRESLVRGALGFLVVSIAGFLPWAGFGRVLYQSIGEAGMYAVCALVFIGLSAPVLHRLIIGPGSMVRFYQVFAASFTVYSILWIVGWMTLRGHPGSIVGLLAGTTAMGIMLALAFGAIGNVTRIIAALFILNTAGYFLGGVVEGALLNTEISKVLAKSSWGVFYGLGFGAGLGWAFYLCQAEARKLIEDSAKG